MGHFNAKLSDFGLAKTGPRGDDTYVDTSVIGTFGYAAPEYIATGRLYVTSHVYAFGVVLLEMLTGLRAIDRKRQSGQHNLVDWLKPSLLNRRKLIQVMDQRLENQFPVKAAVQAAQLTVKCLAGEPENRPSMKEVLKSLEQIQAIKLRVKETRTTSAPQHIKRVTTDKANTLCSVHNPSLFHQMQRRWPSVY